MNPTDYELEECEHGYIRISCDVCSDAGQDEDGYLTCAVCPDNHYPQFEHWSFLAIHLRHDHGIPQNQAKDLIEYAIVNQEVAA